jgi:hypothetical protein
MCGFANGLDLWLFEPLVAPSIFSKMRMLRALRTSVIVLCPAIILVACRPDTVLAPAAPAPRTLSNVLADDDGQLPVAGSTSPSASAALTNYPYLTAVALRLSGTISMTSNSAYYSAYNGPLDGHGILASSDCYAYVRFTYSGSNYGPQTCAAWPSPQSVWEDTAFVSGPAGVFRVGGVPLSGEEELAHGMCNHLTQPCYEYSGFQTYHVNRVPAELTLAGYAGVDPGNAVTVSASVAPKYVRDMGIPFLVQRWRWVPANFSGLPTIPNVPGCTPPADGTNPAVCTPTPATSGTLEIDAIVNGVPETARKNIGVAPKARVCSAKVLKDFWDITAYYNHIDAVHSDPHVGRDYADDGIRGTPVYAAEAGTVALTPHLTGTAGNTVIINSGGLVNSYYQHLDSFAPGLAKGQQVAAGDLLGYVGSTGHAVCNSSPTCDPAHLHFQQHMPGGPLYYSPKSGTPPRETRVEPCFF